MNKRYLGSVAIGVFVILVIGLVIFNKWIQGEVSEIVKHPTSAPTAPLSRLTDRQEKISQPKKGSVAVIRKTRLAPERTYETSIFFKGGEEIARYKASNGMVYDRTGEVPNGKVKFINESDETYGIEYYQDGEKHGPSRTNYKDGQLKQKANYQNGKLMTSTEYYNDGTVKMEEDYNDARDYNDKREVGIGKVYSRNGALKYEWHLTNSDPVGFNKSYNQRGELTSEIYFDGSGAVIQQP